MRILPLALFTLLSPQALAVVDGTPVNWNERDNIVRLDSSNNSSMYCTATLIGGRYALTAAHCLDVNNKLDEMATGTKQVFSITQSIPHPDYVDNGSFSTEDIGIVTTDFPIDYKNIQFLNIDNHTENEAITVAGFGGTVETLNQADFTFSYYYPNPDDPEHPFAVYAEVVNESHTTNGDSGAGWTNKHDELVVIHKGSSTYVDWDDEGNEIRYRKTYGTDIQAAQNFILETIDAWHYPTLVDTNDDGKATITVQSLHYNGVMQQAFTEGDATLLINESSCMTKAAILPFDKCTYVIESNGAEGALYLSADEVIQINKSTESTGGGDGGDSSDGDSGGSMGAWPLILLGLAAYRRKR